MDRKPKNILITGASSGLGAALALAYAEKDVTLFLSGRNEPRLIAVADKARRKGAEVYPERINVTDSKGMAAWIHKIEQSYPLDLVIANAGISAGTGGGDETPVQSEAIFATNVQGVFNTLWPALEGMKKRHSGQLALMASLAGFRGLAGAPSYCASKACVRVYGEALRAEMAACGIKVNVICPGFVETPMTGANGFPMPFLMQPDEAAQIIKKGLAANKPRLTFPWRLAALVWILAALPPRIMDPLLARLPKKA